jgi:uncharacterized membrane protein YbhN (UPF0104 family)
LRTVVTSRWFRVLISAALLALLLRGTDLQAMRAAVAAADARWLLLALMLMVLSQVVSAYRWAILAWAIGFTESFDRFCVYYFSGMYLNLFGPGTVAGDIGRVLFLAGGRRRALALTSVVAHRALGFVALLWIAATAVMLLPDPSLPRALGPLGAAAIPLTIAGWLWGPRLLARLSPPTSRWRVLVERDLAPYWHDRTLLAVSLAWAAAMHGLQLCAQMIVARALGLHLPWAFFLVVVPVVNVAGTLPFSLQGVGIREAGYWAYLARLGVPREQALAVGLLMSMIILASGLIGLPAFLVQRRQEAPAQVGPG